MHCTEDKKYHRWVWFIEWCRWRSFENRNREHAISTFRNIRVWGYDGVFENRDWVYILKNIRAGKYRGAFLKPWTVRTSAFFGEFSLFSENFCIRGVSDWLKLKKSSFIYWKLFLECFSMIPSKNLKNLFWNFWVGECEYQVRAKTGPGGWKQDRFFH